MDAEELRAAVAGGEGRRGRNAAQRSHERRIYGGILRKKL